MKISNKLTDEERHFIQNLISSGQGEVPNAEGKVSSKAVYKLVVDKGFIINALRIIKRPLDNSKKS